MHWDPADDWPAEALHQECYESGQPDKPPRRDVSRTGRPDRRVTVEVYSSRLGELVSADVEVECDERAAVLRIQFAEGGLPLDVDQLTADEKQRACDKAVEQARYTEG